MRVPHSGQKKQVLIRPLSHFTQNLFSSPRDQLKRASRNGQAHTESAPRLALAFSAMAYSQAKRLSLHSIPHFAALTAAIHRNFESVSFATICPPCSNALPFGRRLTLTLSPCARKHALNARGVRSEFQTNLVSHPTVENEPWGKAKKTRDSSLRSMTQGSTRQRSGGRCGPT